MKAEPARLSGRCTKAPSHRLLLEAEPRTGALRIVSAGFSDLFAAAALVATASLRDLAGQRVPFKAAERALLEAYHGHTFADSAPLREILLVGMPSFPMGADRLRLSGQSLYRAVVARARQADNANGA